MNGANHIAKGDLQIGSDSSLWSCRASDAGTPTLRIKTPTHLSKGRGSGGGGGSEHLQPTHTQRGKSESTSKKRRGRTYRRRDTQTSKRTELYETTDRRNKKSKQARVTRHLRATPPPLVHRAESKSLRGFGTNRENCGGVCNPVNSSA